jgi:16S rRNA processing protein RimM
MLDISDKNYLGKILKVHGVSGEVILQSKALASFEEIEMELVFLLIEGKPVPFFISSFRPKSTETFIVAFDYINTPKQALDIVNATVYADERLSDKLNESSGFYKYIGYTVYDQNNKNLGVIQEILESTANPLFSIVQDNKESLIPASEDFILKSYRRKKALHMHIPEGLLDLN